MVSQTVFTLFVVLLCSKKLHDLRRSKKNRALLIKKGGRVYSNAHFPIILGINCAWAIAVLLEIWVWPRPIHWGEVALAMAVFLTSQVLSHLAMKELGIRWTTDVITVPDLPPITTGIFRYLRHPNYWGVFLEMVSVPLLHSAYFTSLIFAVVNLIHLRMRIAMEEKALDQDSDYYAAFARKARNLF